MIAPGRRAAHAALLALVASVALVPSSGRAQVRLERYQPAPGEGVLSTEAPPRAAGTRAALQLTHAARPLRVHRRDDALGPVETEVVSRQLGAHLTASARLRPGLALAASATATPWLDGSHDGNLELAPGRAGFGDSRLGLRVAGRRRGPLTLGGSVWLRLPTSTGGPWTGDDHLGAAARALAELRFGSTRVLLDLGARTAPRRRVANLALGPQLEARVALEHTLGTLQLLGELQASTGLGPESFLDLPETHVEARAGARISVGPVELLAALGVGLVRGYGTPAHRGLVGVSARFGGAPPRSDGALPAGPAPAPSLAPEDADTDGDGVPDARDLCVDTPEDVDGNLDRDGCPEPDATAALVDAAIALAGRTSPGHGVAGPLCTRELRGAVFFATDRHTLDAPGEASVRALASWLASTPGGVLEVLGHADVRGAPSHNDPLSWRRARAVADALHRLGARPGRVRLRALGARAPAGPGTDAATLAASRRVEIRLRPPCPSSTPEPPAPRW
ncbi:MAG TPA: OmpA family protein [Polyangiaceae bacterium LLY-WYZ-15_(1-7)]|nr:hypothetical protein [Sandaracinus sp.]MBJ71005.1 hypothetical protein [Sandaracinus sp.]HJL03805.1 OmpA family protein [Polyangiaceae bacterium LLY-WYZ-15_(1-7)]HJL07541.1 OmpA family protein [Polyangiaceae bacterium LLY-WYZ-15_(1-7)]